MNLQQQKLWQISYWSHTWRLIDPGVKKKFLWLVVIHFLLSLLFVSKQGVLFDESDYYTYAYLWAKGEPMRSASIMDSKTPVAAVSLLAALAKPFLSKAYLANDVFFYLKLGRPFMYVFQLLGMYVMLCWLYRINDKKWFVPLLLYAFDPLIFSYGMFVGSDLASAALLVSVVYCAWRFVTTNDKKYWLFLSVIMAVSVVTKASMLYSYPLLLLLFFLSGRKLKKSPKQILAGILAFIAIQLLVINVCWYFTGTFTRFGQYGFESSTLKHLQSSLAFLSPVPMPFPTPFIQGIDMLKHHAEIGGCLPESTYNGVVLFDKVWCNQSVWYYYIVTALFKLPLFTWLLIVISVARFIIYSRKQEMSGYPLFPLVSFFYFLVILSFANKFQIGIRHAIILLPFLFLMISNTVNVMYYSRRKVFAVLIALHAISMAMYIPNLIAYTNELIRDKTNACHILRDSSIDYGQSGPWVKDFISKHPGYRQPSNIPDTGKFIIGIGELYAEREGGKKDISWLRNNFKAKDNYRYTLLLFEISEKQLRDKGLR